MRILLDHCVPRTLRRFLVGHVVRTTAQCGWADVDNGALLAKASREFDVFLTVDQNIEFQRHLKEIPLSVIVLVAPDNRAATLQHFVPFIEQTLAEMKGRQFARIHRSGKIEVVIAL